MLLRLSAGARSARLPAAAGLVLYGLAATAAPLTLEEAWRIAEQANPALRAAQSELFAARGRLAEARAPLFNNPAISLEGARVRYPAQMPGERTRDWRAGVSLSQTFELAGQPRRRREAAAAELEAVGASLAETRAQVRAEVERRFVQVLARQLRSELERQTVSIVERAAAAMAERLDAGEASRLDANLARVESERARNQLVQLDEQLTLARSELAGLLQLPPGELPPVQGELRREAPYTLEGLLEAASRRPQLEALARREDAARSRLELERAARYPDVTVGLLTSREGGPDFVNAVGLSVALPLPLFRRNEAGIGRAMTELAQVEVERQAAGRDAAAGVRAQWQRVSQLETRARGLREAVLRTLEENQRLSASALKEGEIGIAELLLVNRQVAEVRRELLDVETELRQARVELERSAGWPPLDSREAR